VSDATAKRYRLDELKADAAALATRVTAGARQFLAADPRNPFPDIVMSGTGPGLGKLRVSLIMERNGQYVAVVNEKVLSVGDSIAGLSVIRITPDTVVFARDK